MSKNFRKNCVSAWFLGNREIPLKKTEPKTTPEQSPLSQEDLHEDFFYSFVILIIIPKKSAKLFLENIANSSED